MKYHRKSFVSTIFPHGREYIAVICSMLQNTPITSVDFPSTTIVRRTLSHFPFFLFTVWLVDFSIRTDELTRKAQIKYLATNPSVYSRPRETMSGRQCSLRPPAVYTAPACGVADSTRRVEHAPDCTQYERQQSFQSRTTVTLACNLPEHILVSRAARALRSPAFVAHACKRLSMSAGFFNPLATLVARLEPVSQ